MRRLKFFWERQREDNIFAVQQWVRAQNLENEYALLFEKVRAVVNAIENQGLVPKYQNFVARKHREEWPALWQAIDDLVEEHMKKRRP